MHKGVGVTLLVDELFLFESVEYAVDEFGFYFGCAEFLLQVAATSFATGAVGAGTAIEEFEVVGFHRLINARITNQAW